MACDVFWLFDPNWTGEISRTRYVAGLAESPTVDKLRMLRKSSLENRFRLSATPVSMSEWISMIWPGSTEKELELMMRWAALREAWSIVHRPGFRGLEQEMNRVFHLLDTDKFRGDVPLGELVRAQILTPEECLKLFRTRDLHSPIVNREAFRNVVHPHLKAHYVTADTKRAMKQDEEALISSQLDSAFSGITKRT